MQSIDADTSETAQASKNDQELVELRSIMGAVNWALARIEFTVGGIITDANDNFLNAIGYSLEEVRGKHHEMFLFPEDKNSAEYSNHWRDLKAGKMNSGEFRRRNKQGEEIWITANYTPVFDDNGNTCKVVKFARDITDRVVAVSALRDGLRVLADGNLHQSIETVMAPEYDRLRQDFNEAQVKLAHTMQDVVHSAVEIDGSTERLNNSIQSLSKRTEQQARRLDETTQQIREMASRVEHHSSNVDQARDMVQKTMDYAEAGAQVMAQARDAMDGIAQSSTEITKITSVIDQISFQTNLLALNAGVEAARAGEAGRGFAVVASEVRALAQRSSEAATQIAELIETSSSQVQNGVNLVSKTNDSLAEIGRFVSEALEQVSGIAEGTSQQSDGLRSVEQSASSLDELTKQNAAMFEENSAEMAVLANETGSLRTAAEAFQLSASSDQGSRKRA